MTTHTSSSALPQPQYGKMLDTKRSFEEFLGMLLAVVTKATAPVEPGMWGVVYCDLLALLSSLESLVDEQEAYNMLLARESVETARMLVDTWAKRNVVVYSSKGRG